LTAVLLHNNLIEEEQKMYILVTGASSGIGREIAVELSNSYNIILNGRNQSRLEETVKACNVINNHLIWPFDLENINKVEDELMVFLEKNNCTVVHFIHAAGQMKAIPLKMLSVDSFLSSFNVNVITAAMISKVLIKKKVNQDTLKSIVFISSNISNFGAKAFSAYASSKAAIDGLMRCLSVELAPKVRVNSVLPGGVRTAMTEHMYQNTDLIKRMEAVYPLGLGTTQDICAAVNFLISNNARWITGQQLIVDGGRTINITG
jgi:NAD(P)-dependent dehydrogenase (short-subunit alcohol dehydrogenase family)